MTAAATAYPLARERNFILGSLLVLAAFAWAIIVWQALEVDDDDAGMAAQPGISQANVPAGAPAMDGVAGDDMSMGLTMDMSALLFVALWAAMMVAIMFPTAAPMILTFARVQANRKQRGQVFVPSWLFAGSYITLWSATGILAYAAAVGGDALADNWSWLMDNAARIGGGVLILAGIYQLSPLKRVCLSKCRTPMSFILSSWRDGNRGAIRMGFQHGVYCLGCCWMLFIILFPLGMMNVAAMAVITVLIFAEKSLPIGRQAAMAAAVLLIAWGAVAVAVPSALPTTL